MRWIKLASGMRRSWPSLLWLLTTMYDMALKPPVVVRMYSGESVSISSIECNVCRMYEVSRQLVKS